jgi:hypothetical protein
MAGMDVVGMRRIGNLSAFAGALLALLTTEIKPARAIELSREVAELYTSVSIEPPSEFDMPVCYGFVCRLRTTLVFSAADRAALTAIMAKGGASPDAERKALQQAVVWFDRRMGPVIGTSKRVALADFRAGNDSANFDCWDTTRNTASLLLVLQSWKLLRHHRVGNPQYRGNLLIGQTPHNTATVIDNQTKVAWVVDMWPTGYAQVPDVMTLERWLTER